MKESTDSLRGGRSDPIGWPAASVGSDSTSVDAEADPDAVRLPRSCPSPSVGLAPTPMLTDLLAAPASLVASAAGFRSTPGSIVYSGIKAGVMGMTRAAAVDLGSRQIRVNAIAPSATPTEGTERNRNADRDAKRIAQTPLGRLGHVDDMALAITFLLSNDSRYITGQTLPIDGGIGTSFL